MLILILCCAGAHAQSEDRDGNDNQPYVTLPLGSMNQVLTTIDNRQLRLSDYPDRIIVMNLFASWCGPCVFNLRDLVQLKNKYKTHRIEIIALVRNQNDPDVERLRKFLRKQKLNFQVVRDKDDFSETLVKAVNGQGVIPQTFIIDKDGRIRKHFQGYRPLNMPQLLREALDQVGKEEKRTGEKFFQ